MKLEIAATGAMSRFYCPSGGRDGIDRGFTQPGDEGPFYHTGHTRESEYHGPANMNLQARGAQRAGQDSAQLYRTEPITTAVQPKGSDRRREPQQRYMGPPPGIPLAGLARASQPAPSTNAPAERVTQHASRSTAMVPQRIPHPLVFPEGCTITQALKIALGSDTTKTTAPALATITTSASAEKSSNGVVQKQQATASSASFSLFSTPHGPTTPRPPQPSLSISHQGMPEAAAAAVACLEPVSAPASTLGSSSSNGARDFAHSSVTVSQMLRGGRKKARTPRPPPGVRKRMAAEAAERAAAGAQLAALMVAHLRAAAAAADAAQAAADQAAAVAADP